MADATQQFIDFLQKDIKEWQEAAEFYDKYIHSAKLPEEENKSGKEMADMFRKRIEERQNMIERVKSEV
jgi:hypothetical protein